VSRGLRLSPVRQAPSEACAIHRSIAPPASNGIAASFHHANVSMSSQTHHLLL
jgi:hypothetical protein